MGLLTGPEPSPPTPGSESPDRCFPDGQRGLWLGGDGEAGDQAKLGLPVLMNFKFAILCFGYNEVRLRNSRAAGETWKSLWLHAHGVGASNGRKHSCAEFSVVLLIPE